MARPWEEWRCSGTCDRTNGTHPQAGIEERYSLGLYAGRYCDPCWKESGYRDEGPEGFDPTYAGESYEEVW